jgi:antitoxin (DNA-binding transcriptional repressor) of toxin-antitoxin stability system
MQTISATDLARNTRNVLDTVVGTGETVLVERNRMTIARIVPQQPAMTASQALAGFQPVLTPEQAERWLADSRNTFDESVADPWA